MHALFIYLVVAYLCIKLPVVVLIGAIITGLFYLLGHGVSKTNEDVDNFVNKSKEKIKESFSELNKKEPLKEEPSKEDHKEKDHKEEEQTKEGRAEEDPFNSPPENDDDDFVFKILK
jgi:hypothetical protein